MTETDDDLVLRAQAGSRGAFEELIRRTSKLVFARIYLETGDHQLAEDLAQETFLAAYRRLHQLTDKRRFRAWLLTIAHNLVIDDVKRRGRKRRAHGEMAEESALAMFPDSVPTPDHEAQNNETRDEVLSVLRSLPDEYRLPLTLRYAADADYATICTQLGLSNGSLRGLLHRGLKMMRERLPEGFGQ